MDIRISRGKFQSAALEAISSKSYVHRQLIAGGLSDDKITIVTNIKSNDMEATAGCLCAMGAELTATAEGYTCLSGVQGGAHAELDCGESGSTARFLMPVAAHFYDTVKLDGHGSLVKRPFQVLCEALSLHGVTSSSNLLPIEMHGRISAGRYEIPGNISSQYISGLLFALPLLADGDSELVLTSPLQSEGYVEMTLAVLRQFGIAVEKRENIYRIRGGQQYHFAGKDRRIVSEGDWSNGAYLLSIGAVGGSVSLSRLNPASIQGDRAFLDGIRQLGAEVFVDTEREVVTVSKGTLRGTTLDVRNVPDLVPALAVTAAFAEGESRFVNVKRLRIKESDRVREIERVLAAIGAHARTEKTADDLDLIVSPIGTVPEEICIDGANDHRMVMAGAIAAAGLHRPITIMGAEAVAKSYPGFFDMCREALGMEAAVL